MPDLNDPETVSEVRKRSEDWWLKFLWLARNSPGVVFLLGMPAVLLIFFSIAGGLMFFHAHPSGLLKGDQGVMYLVVMTVTMPSAPTFFTVSFLMFGAFFRMLGIGNWFGNPTGFIDKLMEASKHRSRVISQSSNKRWISVHNLLAWAFVLGVLMIFLLPISMGARSLVASNLGWWSVFWVVIAGSVICTRWLVNPIKVRSGKSTK